MKTCTIMFWFRRKYSFVKLEIENGFNLGVMLGSWVTFAEVLVNSYISCQCNYKVQLSTWSHNVLLVVSSCVILETTVGRSKHKCMHRYVAITCANHQPNYTNRLVNYCRIARYYLGGLGKMVQRWITLSECQLPHPISAVVWNLTRPSKDYLWPLLDVTFDNYIEFENWVL